MSDERNGDTVEPISASADGKRNAWCVSCPATNQKMNYAACLHRAEFIDKPEVRKGAKVPKDWNECDRSPGRHERACVARAMRMEEEAAGKAIYFVARSFISTLAASASKWVMDRVGNATTPAAATKVKKDLFDAIGSVGSMADAVNTMSKAAPVVPVPRGGLDVPLQPAKPLPKAQAGESPLQMARRLAAEKPSKT